MENTAIRPRAEIPVSDTWDLTRLYADEEAWEKDLSALMPMAEAVAAFAGTLGDGAATVARCLALETGLSRKMENVYTYAKMRQDEDNTLDAPQTMTDRAMSVNVAISEKLAFLQPELLSLDDAVLASYLTAAELAEYRRPLEELIRQKPHTLSAPEEQILAGMGELAASPQHIFTMLNSADMKYDPILTGDGTRLDVTNANFILLQTSEDRSIREKAFASFYAGYRSHANTLAAAYSASVKKDVFFARTRHYASALQMSLDDENIPIAVYDNLITVIRDRLPVMHRYVELRKKLLSLDALHCYDMYAPLVAELNQHYSFDQAKELVAQALKPLGDEYGQILQTGLNSRWIDVYENKGKSSGAYSWGTYDSSPYVLLNFTGTLDSVSTLAHEMGHSLHSYYSNQHQPYQTAGYKLFVAEVASTVNENLLIEYLLRQDIEDSFRLYLLNQYLENFKGTMYRQTMFAEFERETHALVESGNALNSTVLSNLYASLYEQYHGPALTMDADIRYEWSRIPHFYRPFYVYKYATGYSAAVYLSEQILSKGSSAVTPYLEFLSLGGSQDPLDSLLHAGVDMTRPEPISLALDKFDRILSDAEEIAAR